MIKKTDQTKKGVELMIPGIVIGVIVLFTFFSRLKNSVKLLDDRDDECTVGLGRVIRSSRQFYTHSSRSRKSKDQKINIRSNKNSVKINKNLGTILR